jgi:hypothetical protein
MPMECSDASKSCMDATVNFSTIAHDSAIACEEVIGAASENSTNAVHNILTCSILDCNNYNRKSVGQSKISDDTDIDPYWLEKLGLHQSN